MTERRDEDGPSEAWDEVDQPGLGDLRVAVAQARSRIPTGGTIRRDGVAGLNAALSSVPDGMASGLLVGVNPIYGLYACTVGPIASALASSSSLMVVATTSASALAAGQALGGRSGFDRENALFLLVLLIGAFQILSGLLRLGRLTRFVSFSVMTGFVGGIAVLTILSQLPTLTGFVPSAAGKVEAALELMTHLGDVSAPTVGVSVVALTLAIVLPRTRVGKLGTLAAIAIPSVAVALGSVAGVQRVRDVSEIPSGIPLPSLPSLSGMSLDIITGAVAIAAVILIQGAGVSQSVPNPDGAPRRLSRDFVAQGLGNVTAGLFRGLPVGGSLSTTALSMLSGARSRWAPIFAGAWMAAIVVFLSGMVSAIAMPTLAAVLVVASLSTIKPREVTSLLKTGLPSRIASATTFVATLLLPIQLAVALGVALSAVLHLYEAAADVAVVELVERPDGRIEERSPARQLPPERVTVLDVYGHLFFAGARTLERSLPRIEGTRHAAVVLRLRGRTTVGATLIDVLAGYAEKLRRNGGRLYLSGVSGGVLEQMRRTGKLRVEGPVHVYEMTTIVGESTRRAAADARAWLVEAAQEPSREDPSHYGRP